MKKRPLTITNALLGLLVLAMLVNPIFAGANHQPADKVVAQANKVAVFSEEMSGENGVTILDSTFKTSGPTDLMVHVTLECSILTRVVTPGDPEEGATSTGEAAGRIRVWLEFDGKRVDLNQVSMNPQPNDPPEIGDDSDKVTFCNRHNRNTLTDAEDPMDGVDEMEVYLNTKNANAFNWVILNTGGWGGTDAGHNIHELVVKAQFDEADPNGTVITANAESEASGFVGNRTLIVEPTKMSNHASV